MNTIVNMKRLVGLSFDEPRAQQEMRRVPFTCVPIKHASGGPDSIGVKVHWNNEETILPIEAVTGMMVKHLGTIAGEKAAEGSQTAASELFPQDWVIAIPPYYGDAQRRAFLVGCEIAGISGVLRLMHENTATALAYGIFKDVKKEFTKDKPTNVMFIDMGSSCYTVSIVAFEPGKLIVKSCYFDENLGGRDFDDLIANWIAEEFETKYKGKLSGKPMESPKVRLKILAAAEKAKKTLSPEGVREVAINLECLMDDRDFHCNLKADKYDAMCKPLLARLAKPIEQSLAEAKITSADLDSVEIVGGSTRIGSVKKTLSALLGKSMSTTMNADEAVARGAALQSAILSARFKVLPYEIHDAEPFPINVSWDEETEQGVEVDGDAEGSDLPANSVIMFDRGLSFPIVRRVTLRRHGEFKVTAAYSDSAAQFGLAEGAQKEIATFTIKSPPGDDKKIRVNVKQDIHGIINLSSAQMVEEFESEEEAPKEEAKEGEEPKKKKTIKKTNLEFSVSRPLDWTKAEIEAFYEKEVAMANADRIHRETADKRNELESYIYDMRDKIISDSHLAPYATDDEKETFSSLLETTENWLYEDGFDATKSVYTEKLAALHKIGGPIQYRQAEAAARGNAQTYLQRTVEHYKTWLNESQADAKYAHITEEERMKAHEKCDEVSNWMYDMMDKQGSLALSADPVFSVAEIQAKTSDLTNVVNPIMYKPAPKPEAPKKEDEPMEKAAENENVEEKKAGEEAEAMEIEEVKSEGGDEPMELV